MAAAWLLEKIRANVAAREAAEKAAAVPPAPTQPVAKPSKSRPARGQNVGKAPASDPPSSGNAARCQRKRVGRGDAGKAAEAQRKRTARAAKKRNPTA